MTSELHLEQLIGRCVYDSVGNRVGRIEEVHAKQQGDDWVILEYLVGTAAIVERLSAWNLGTGLLHFLGARKLNKSYRIPWNQLDLSNPEHPRLICTVEKLKEISQQLEADESQESTS
jgi:sporulation protein YlmC with PRC-barrel domain